MSILDIVEYPASVLTKPGDSITAFDPSLLELAEKMFTTMYAAQGVGLAACQVGLALRLFVMDCDGVKLVAANPEIVHQSGLQDGDEGCLSLQGAYYPLQRPREVTLRAQDLHGNSFELNGRDLVARCFLHETDHCDGKLFISRLSPLKRDIVTRKLRRKRREAGDRGRESPS